MLKWSRVRLYLSILTCEGLFATLRERVQVAAPAQGEPQDGHARRRAGAAFSGQGSPEPELPGFVAPREPDYYDYCGGLHVHSTYSDGAGTVEQIAEAANRAGLDFVLLCDHATFEARQAGQDGWHGRTLVMVGTEVATDTGHLLALAVPDEFLPASGNAAIDQERIIAQGGIGFIALPCDLKDHWQDFGARRSGIGLEVFNLGAIARTKINVPAIMLALLRYKGKRPHRAFHLIASRPTAELKLWDTLMLPKEQGGAYDPVVGIASVDAHAVMKFGGKSYPYPTYYEVFRTVRTHVLLSQPLQGTMSQANLKTASEPDQARLHAAIRSGHCYMAYDNYGDSTGFVFEASQGNLGGILMGDAMQMDGSGPSVRLVAKAPRTRSFVRLYRDGVLVASARGGRLEYEATIPGAYRVEVFLYRRRMGNLCLGVKPWIFSNPIYLHPARSGVGRDGRAAGVSDSGERKTAS